MVKKVAIIIPTYNESENLPVIVKKISEVFKNNKITGDIIIVDDSSPDKTAVLAKKLSKKYPVKVVVRTKDRGYGNSTLEGFRTALRLNYSVIITMDADLSHDPQKIPVMLQEINKGNDVIIGSRRVCGGKIEGWNFWRHFCSSGARWFSSFMLGLKTKDITSGYRAYEQQVIRAIPLDSIKSNGYSFLEELLYYVEKNKFKIKEIPIIFQDRKFGKSKLSKIEILKFFLTIFRLKISSFFKR